MLSVELHQEDPWIYRVYEEGVWVCSSRILQFRFDRSQFALHYNLIAIDCVHDGLFKERKQVYDVHSIYIKNVIHFGNDDYQNEYLLIIKFHDCSIIALPYKVYENHEFVLKTTLEHTRKRLASSCKEMNILYE